MKLKEIAFWGIIWGIIYFSTNNISIFQMHTLPLLPCEKEIVFSNWWMILYVSWVLYNILFCLSITKNAKRYTALLTGLIIIHALIFMVYPTEYPRTYDYNSLCAINKLLLSLDNPQNCLPSLHVSFIFFSFLIAPSLGVNGIKRFIFVFWGALIMASVVFVKQHYVIDIVAGILLTTCYYYLTRKFLKSKN